MRTVFVVYVILFAGFAFTCKASTVYNVGDSSGWDVSTELGSWEQGKVFTVGDVLWFQYSSYHNVCEVTRDNYEKCNTTNVLQSYTGGNTTLPLTSPGDKYFTCSNRLHCLGGMKLHVHVEEDQGAAAPAPLPSAAQAALLPPSSPQAQPAGGSLPHHSSKTNYNSSSVPSLISFNYSVLGLLILVLLVF